MSTLWPLIEVCLAHARTAEHLLGRASARRELRRDPEDSLAAFALWKGPLPTAHWPRPLTPIRSRAYTPARP
jgi:hypothetical protein